MLAGLAPLTFRVGGTFTDLTTMAGPHPGISKRLPLAQQENFSAVAFQKLNQLAQWLPDSKMIVAVNGLLRHWDKPGTPWDPTNAASFIAANIASNYDIFGYLLRGINKVIPIPQLTP
jgi:hypothetical protein